MDNATIIIGAAAIITYSLMQIVKAVLAARGHIGYYDKYRPYMVMAAKWVEEAIPDTDHKEDTGNVEKSLNKLDEFLKKFIELVERGEKETPNEILIDEAKKWSVILAKSGKTQKG